MAILILTMIRRINECIPILSRRPELACLLDGLNVLTQSAVRVDAFALHGCTTDVGRQHTDTEDERADAFFKVNK